VTWWSHCFLSSGVIGVAFWFAGTDTHSKWSSKPGVENMNTKLTTLEKHDVPLAEVTTSSLEALKAYSAAWQIQSSAGSAAVVPLFKRAIEIDTEFALA